VVVIAMTGAILLRLLGRLVVGKRVFLAGGVVMGRRSLVARLLLALVDRRFLIGQRCRYRFASMGCGAFGLLYGNTLEEGAQFFVGPSPLHGGWFGHPSEEYHHDSDILACLSEERRLVIVIIDDDASMDVVSPMSGCSVVVAVPELLLEAVRCCFRCCCSSSSFRSNSWICSS
jgi:hypothetical protein